MFKKEGELRLYKEWTALEGTLEDEERVSKPRAGGEEEDEDEDDGSEYPSESREWTMIFIHVEVPFIITPHTLTFQP